MIRNRCSRRAPARACGAFGEADDLDVAASHQVIDARAVTASVTQYNEHAVRCHCRKVHVAAPPAGAGEAGSVTYGLNLQAWVVFLLVMHHDRPRRKCRLGREGADQGAGHHPPRSSSRTRPHPGWPRAEHARGFPDIEPG
jgi:hypothetical protein